ncbi:MAG: 50S ribosomal protein L18 [Candidatus Nanoarchaeia archaeon]
MAHGPRYAVKFRRRREGKTNYAKRLALLKSGLPRLVVRSSNNKIIGQIIAYDPKGDRTLLTVLSTELKNYGWTFGCKNTPAAYLTGVLLGKKALEKNIKDVVLDIGLKRPTKGAKVFAFAKGAKDAGLQLNLSDKNIPSEERIKGKHIADWLKKDVQTTFNNVLESIKEKIENTREKREGIKEGTKVKSKEIKGRGEKEKKQ